MSRFFPTKNAIIGEFDEQNGCPRVYLKIKGTKKEKEIKALFDTGHSGSLSLPLLTLIEIGAELKGISRVSYADGNIGTVYLFSVKVEMNGIKKEVKANLIPNPSATEALVGVELFAPFVVFLDFNNKKMAIIKEGELKKITERGNRDSVNNSQS